MHPGIFAAKDPGRPAVVMGAAGTVVTYQQLEANSNRVAWLARQHGLRPGDGLAVIVENRRSPAPPSASIPTSRATGCGSCSA
jgi:fatty-acyl-CoA synthase